jgi:hypothetical protein
MIANPVNINNTAYISDITQSGLECLTVIFYLAYKVQDGKEHRQIDQ